MKPIEAEKLLGGYATGTLTEAERSRLFAAALEDQAIFDALADEEALRDLLSDPGTRAQLIAALAPPAVPKVVPFWRRPGVLGAAAGLLVAATAGFAILRSPDQGPPPLRQETPKVAPTPAPAQTSAQTLAAPVTQKTAPAKPPAAPAEARPVPPPPPQMLGAAREEAQDRLEARHLEAQANLAKKEVAPPAAALMELAPKAAAPEPRPGVQAAPSRASAELSAGLVSSMAPRAKAKAAVPRAPALPKDPALPTWTLEPGPEGSTRVEVRVPGPAEPLLLQRRASGVTLPKPQAREQLGADLVLWRWQLRLSVGDALDLYLLSAPVAEPAQLPETGPVDGYRARIYPIQKKDPAP